MCVRIKQCPESWTRRQYRVLGPVDAREEDDEGQHEGHTQVHRDHSPVRPHQSADQEGKHALTNIS